MPIYRIDVLTTASARGADTGVDPVGEALRHQIAEFGLSAGAVGPIRTRRIFLIDADATDAQMARAAAELLADPIVETSEIITSHPAAADANAGDRIEIHLKPGVMDPVAASTEMALRDLGVAVKEVRTGRAYLFDSALPRAELESIATRLLANGVIESIHFEPFIPERFEAGRAYELKLLHVALRELDDDALTKLSREGHLFLSLEEMKAIQSYFRQQNREPTDVELETLAQTWSEHCVHKTLKSAVDVEVKDENGQTVDTRHYKNLIKETIFKSTLELTAGGSDKSFCLSVFADNAGVVAFDETDAVCFKVETHNHPSAIEPYGGAATGIGGVIRDILGTGLGAKPIANTDVFCVAYPNGFSPESEPWQRRGSKVAVTFNPPPGTDPEIVDLISGQSGRNPPETRYFISRHELGESIHFIDPVTSIVMGYLIDPPPGMEAESEKMTAMAIEVMKKAGVPVIEFKKSALPKGIIHPKRVLQQIVAGVRDYGNRMGIPTVNGAVYFDDRYLGNPLVFCGCVGLIPRNRIAKAAQAGDAIVVVGGRTGRDGIHGATFSSAELTDTHADEFSHAVQIGNAITEKKTADVILQARDRQLFTAITDCGAGGLSSAVGEMAAETGARVELDKVPLKYAGLRYDEIWISEAQERMVLSVPRAKVAELLTLCRGENVEATEIGTFATDKQELVLYYQGMEVGRLWMEFVHHGVPMPRRIATVPQLPPAAAPPLAMRLPGMGPRTPVRERLLAVLAHPNVASKHWIIRQYDHEVQGGSVIKPLIGEQQIGPSDAAVLRPKLGSFRGIAIGCGMAPHVPDPYKMAIAAIDEAVRNVVAVGADPANIAILDNFCWPSVDDAQTMGTLVRACEACYDAAKEYGIPFISGKDSLHNQFTNSETGEVLRIPNTLLISAIAVLDDVRHCITMDLKRAGHQLGIVRQLDFEPDLSELIATHRRMSRAISAGLLTACHDVSDGGVLTAAAEMCIASGLGLNLKLQEPLFFRETPGCYLVEFEPDKLEELRDLFSSLRVSFEHCGEVTEEPRMIVSNFKQTVCEASVEEMTKTWRGTLDW